MVAKNTRAKALEAELNGADLIEVDIFGETYFMKKKFKRLMFLRLLNTDPIAALELVFVEKDFSRLLELEMDEDGFARIIEAVSESFTGGSKN